MHWQSSKSVLFILLLFLLGCSVSKDVVQPEKISFDWKNATIYFLLTDRFANADTTNDFQHPSNLSPAPYRGFMGGDLKGITAKIEEGYFSELGVDAIWFTPVVEQISSAVDEGTGTSYAFHGYWTRDWTALDNRFGSKADLKKLIETAHKYNIRILIDAVANHTGPVTPFDSQWPDDWVNTSPQCTYEGYKSTVNCTLVKNLPDIKTESEVEVELPEFLIEKWRNEGRLTQELEELDQWFTDTQYPRTPVYYILKWLVDFVKEFGVDGFRVDTAKHTEAYVWAELRKQAETAFKVWRKEHSGDGLANEVPFYMVGEVYNFMASGGLNYDYNDSIVNFYEYGFDALINFDFKNSATNDYEQLFNSYGQLSDEIFKEKTFVNYASSHDDGAPFDQMRTNSIGTGTKLLLCPGSVQIYYGDETARKLDVEAAGDAVLRSFMNWDELENNVDRNGIPIRDVQKHWRKLGKFRQAHPSIASGKHSKIAENPYTFSRIISENLQTDAVVIALDTNVGKKTISVGDVFNNGDHLFDYYSGKSCVVVQGEVELNSPATIVLLAKE